MLETRVRLGLVSYSVQHIVLVEFAPEIHYYVWIFVINTICGIVFVHTRNSLISGPDPTDSTSVPDPGPGYNPMLSCSTHPLNFPRIQDQLVRLPTPLADLNRRLALSWTRGGVPVLQ